MISPIYARLVATLGLTLAGLAGAHAQERQLTPVTFTTSWYAQAEHGGYYAAKALGIYEKHGLDVTIRPGGPQLNNAQILAAGNSDFTMGTHLQMLNAVQAGLPIVSVAAFFQKDPQSLIVHAGSSYQSIADLKGKAIRVPPSGRTRYWPWLRSEFGFTDEQLRPYDFTIAPFIADKEAIQNGFITNDGYLLAKGGVEGRSLLLADFGWEAYSSTLDTTRRMIEQKPEVVAAMVKATAEGWAAYFADPGPAHALIKKDNPEMEDEMMAYTHDALMRLGIVDSGDAEGGRFGMMTDARWESFFKTMVEAGTVPADMDYRAAYTLEFVQAAHKD